VAFGGQPIGEPCAQIVVQRVARTIAERFERGGHPPVHADPRFRRGTEQISVAPRR
jgi:hypothetical protein